MARGGFLFFSWRGGMPTVLITAGPTREHLDDVRFLSNASTGRMGYALVRAACERGHAVVLVSGPTSLEAPAAVTVVPVVSAMEMATAVERHVDDADIVFGVAAVADARPAHRRPGKPPKPAGAEWLELVPNPDVIALAAARPGVRAVIGFALEAPAEGGLDAALLRARTKLVQKRLDAIAVNLQDALGAPDSEVVLLWADGRQQALPRQSKEATATRLVEVGEELWRAKR